MTTTETKVLIKEQGRMIELLRAVRSPATNRIRQVVIGTFRAGETPSAALLEQLDRDERHALDLWLA